MPERDERKVVGHQTPNTAWPASCPTNSPINPLKNHIQDLEGQTSIGISNSKFVCL